MVKKELSVFYQVYHNNKLFTPKQNTSKEQYLIKQTFFNTLSNIILTFSKFMLGILLVPVLIGALGKESYGFIVVLLSIIGISDFFDLGIRQSLIKAVASVKGENRQAIAGYFSNAIIAYHIIFLLASVAVISLFYGLGSFFNLDNIPGSLFRSEVILFLILYIYIGLVQSAYSGLIVSANRFDLNNYRSAFFSIISIVVLIVEVKYFNAGIRGWIYTTLIFKFFELLALMQLKKKLYPAVHFNSSLYNFKSMKELASFGGIIFLATWNKKIKFDSDPFLISHFMTPAAMVLYRPGTSLIQNIRPVISAFAGQLYVSATQANAENDSEKVKKIFLTGTRFTALLCIPFLTFFCFAGKEILSLWLGRLLSTEELQVCYYVLVGWCLIDFFFYLEGSSFSVLFGIGKLKHMIYLDFVIAVANICTGILLFYFFKLGVLSVIIPGVVIELFARLYFLFYTGTQVEVTKSTIIEKVLVKVFFVAAITSSAALVAFFIAPVDSVPSLIFTGALISFTWIAAVFYLGLEKEERQYFWNLSNKKLRWLS